jgi:hypothetical protein
VLLYFLRLSITCIDLSGVILFYAVHWAQVRTSCPESGQLVSDAATIAPTCPAGTSHMLTRVEISVFCGLLHDEGHCGAVA